MWFSQWESQIPQCMIAFKTYQLSVPSDPLGLEAFQFAPLQKQNFEYLLA